MWSRDKYFTIIILENLSNILVEARILPIHRAYTEINSIVYISK
jgi:hypothetical protein